MNKRDIEEIERFLSTVGKSSLFEYFDVPQGADDDAIRAAISKRRGWAQGQQANPKYRQEAIWLIKNVSKCRKALLEHREAYAATLRAQSEQQSIEVLRVYIMGAIAEGRLTDASEAAIREKGRSLGLPDAVVIHTVEEMMSSQRATRADPHEPAPDGPFIDHYAVLEVAPDADLNSVERAYRERYHWARQLDDARRSAEVYARLDEAWAVLRDPSSRARYDEARELALGRDAAVTDGPSFGQHGGEPEREFESAEMRRIGFAADPAAEEEEASAAVPNPPDDLRTTLGLAAGNRSASPRRRATLEVEGDTAVSLEVSNKEVEHRFTVRKVGPRSLPGRIFVDRDWAEVSPQRLDPKADEQTITIRVRPQVMPRNRAVCLVTVLTDDGQRSSITITATRKRRGVLYGGLAAAAALLAVGGWALLSEPPPPPPAPPSARLVLLADPPAGEVWVNGALLNDRGQADLSEGLQPGATASVRVELDGFKIWSEDVVMPGAGETVELRPRLELADRMNYEPTADELKGDIDQAAASAALAKRRKHLIDCVDRHAGVAPGGSLDLDLVVYINNRGRVQGANFDLGGRRAPQALDLCLRRQLRAIQMPFALGDYAEVEDRIRYSAPPATRP